MDGAQGIPSDLDRPRPEVEQESGTSETSSVQLNVTQQVKYLKLNA